MWRFRGDPTRVRSSTAERTHPLPSPFAEFYIYFDGVPLTSSLSNPASSEGKGVDCSEKKKRKKALLAKSPCVSPISSDSIILCGENVRNHRIRTVPECPSDYVRSVRPGSRVKFNKRTVEDVRSARGNARLRRVSTENSVRMP